MQDNIVKAFRQRLIRCGFTYINIYHLCEDNYLVRCISPYGEFIRKELLLKEMYCKPSVIYVI